MASSKKGGAKRLGRPPLPQEELREHRVVVHLTAEEVRKLATVADQRDMDLGAVAREILTNALKRVR